MRTTLDIEDDVLQAAKELAHRDGCTAGKIISELARKGLAVAPTKDKKRPATRGGVPLLPRRGDLITLEHVQRLIDQEGI